MTRSGFGCSPMHGPLVGSARRPTVASGHQNSQPDWYQQAATPPRGAFPGLDTPGLGQAGSPQHAHLQSGSARPPRASVKPTQRANTAPVPPLPGLSAAAAAPSRLQMPGRARPPAVDKHQLGWAGRTTNKALAPRPAQSGVLRATAIPHGIPCAKASALPSCGAKPTNAAAPRDLGQDSQVGSRAATALQMQPHSPAVRSSSAYKCCGMHTNVNVKSCNDDVT